MLLTIDCLFLTRSLWLLTFFIFRILICRLGIWFPLKTSHVLSSCHSYDVDQLQIHACINVLGMTLLLALQSRTTLLFHLAKLCFIIIFEKTIIVYYNFVRIFWLHCMSLSSIIVNYNFQSFEFMYFDLIYVYGMFSLIIGHAIIVLL